ncbi:MAG: DUF3592 domain-containing protein [Phycisphaerales bacterium JB059]
MAPSESSTESPAIIYVAGGIISLIGLGLGVIAGIFVAIGVRETLHQSRLIREAQPVEATVLAAEVIRSSTSQGTGSSRTTSTSFFPSVEFRYERAGQTRTSDRLWAVGQGGDAAWAEAVIQRYPPGTVTSAWVDPDDPGFAFLEKRWTVGPYIMVFVGSFGLGFLISLVAGATFPLPRVALGVMLVGVGAWALAPAWAYAHYLLYANPSGHPPAWLAFALAPYFLGVLLPIWIWRRGQRYRRALELEAAGA